MIRGGAVRASFLDVFETEAHPMIGVCALFVCVVLVFFAELNHRAALRCALRGRGR